MITAKFVILTLESTLSIVAMVWQMMRAYTLGILQSLSENQEKPIKDSDIVDWANQKVNVQNTRLMHRGKVSYVHVFRILNLTRARFHNTRLMHRGKVS